MIKHPNVLRFSTDPLERKDYQHWREQYGTIILRSRERAEALCESREQANAPERPDQTRPVDPEDV
jgi:hypothetical protein